jgi:uncharacterized protein
MRRTAIVVAATSVVALLVLGTVSTMLGPRWDPTDAVDAVDAVDAAGRTNDAGDGGGRRGVVPPAPARERTDPVPPARVRQQEVRLRVRGEVLDGTVVSPRTPGRHPAVAFVVGAGRGPRSDVVPFARSFARAGIVALAYDKRTVGYSAASRRDFGQLADDAAAAAALLARRPDVDPDRVGLWGHSEGAGWVIPAAAAEHDGIAFAILVAGPVCTPAEELLWSVDGLLRRQTAPPGARRAVARMLSVGGFSYASYDPVPALREVTQPVLAVFGTKDVAVLPAQSATALAAALDTAGNDTYTIRFFGGADHSLRTDGKLAPGYLATMTTWVRGLPASAEPDPELQVAGATPAPEPRGLAPPATPIYATAPAIATGHAIVLLGWLLGPVGAFVAWLRHGRRRRPDAPSPAWRYVRGRLAWLAGTGFAAQLAFAAAVAVMLTLAWTESGPGPLPALSWFGARALAVAVVFVGVAAAVVAARAMTAGWRPAPVQMLALAGVGTATLVVLLNAALWGLYAFAW